MNHSESKIRRFSAGLIMTAVLALIGGCGDAASIGQDTPRGGGASKRP